jgi:hypothetical protein
MGVSLNPVKRRRSLGCLHVVMQSPVDRCNATKTLFVAIQYLFFFFFSQIDKELDLHVNLSCVVDFHTFTTTERWNRCTLIMCSYESTNKINFMNGRYHKKRNRWQINRNLFQLIARLLCCDAYFDNKNLDSLSNLIFFFSSHDPSLLLSSWYAKQVQHRKDGFGEVQLK